MTSSLEIQDGGRKPEVVPTAVLTTPFFSPHRRYAV